MKNKNKMLFALFLIISLVVYVTLIFGAFSLNNDNQEESKLAIYNDMAFVLEYLNVENLTIVKEVPSSIDEESIFFSPFENLQTITIEKVDELENNIGKEITVFFGNDKNVTGKLIDYKNGKAYVLSNENIFVVIPKGYIIKSKGNYAKVHIRLKEALSNAVFGYAFHGIKWKAKHNIVIENKNYAKIESSAFITNNTDEEFYGNVKLLAENLQDRYYIPFFRESVAAAKEVSDFQKPSEIQESNVVEDISIVYDVGEIKIGRREKIILPLEEKKISYEFLSYDEIFLPLNRFFVRNAKSETSAKLAFVFEAPYDIAKGTIFVYDNDGKIIARKVISNKAKGEKVFLTIKKDDKLKYSLEALDIKDFKKEISGKYKLKVTNYSEETKKINFVIKTYYRKIKITEKNYRDAIELLFDKIIEIEDVLKPLESKEYVFSAVIEK